MNSGILEYGDISLRKTKPSDVNLLVYHWDMLILTEYPVKQKIDKSMISLTDLGELEMIRSCCSYILVLLVDQLRVNGQTIHNHSHPLSSRWLPPRTPLRILLSLPSPTGTVIGNQLCPKERSL